MSIRMFHEKDAMLYGVNAAVLLYRLRYFIDDNIRLESEEYLIEGKYHAQFSDRDLTTLYPWITERAWQGVIKKLIDAKVIETRAKNGKRWLTLAKKHYPNDTPIPKKVLQDDASIPKKVRDNPEESSGLSLYKEKLKNINSEVEILNHLNKVANKKFRHVKSHHKLIKTLLRNYPSELVKSVLSYKAGKWLGTKYEMYLRPSTLFRESKFDEYVNEMETDQSESDSENIFNDELAAVLRG